MKKNILILTLVLVYINSYSQDTIRFINKEMVVAKITEINVNDIKYQRFDNLTGPQYTVSKKEISSIKFLNGQIENFETATSSIQTSQLESKKESETTSGPTKIYIHGKRLSYNNRGLGDTKLLMLIQNFPTAEGKSKLMKEYATMKDYKSTQYVAGFAGLGLALLSPIVGAAIASETPSNGGMFIANNRVQTVLGSLAIGVVVGVAGSVVSTVFKAKRFKKRNEIAEMYNNRR